MEEDAVERTDRYAVSSGEAGDVSLLLAISCSGGRRHRPYLNQGRDESCRIAAGKGRSCKAEGRSQGYGGSREKAAVCGARQVGSSSVVEGAGTRAESRPISRCKGSRFLCSLRWLYGLGVAS